MPVDYSYTPLQTESGVVHEVQFMPSTLEVIDRAMFRFIDEELDLHADSVDGWRKVPALWVSAERAFQIKHNKELRDPNGVLKLPLITLERTSVEKDPAFKGTFQAHVPDSGRIRRITIPAAQTIQHEKTSNFQNAWTARRHGHPTNPLVGHGQLNFPAETGKKNRTVYQVKYLPIPVWVKVMYSLKIRSEYMQQMNNMFQPFLTKTGQINNFFITEEGHRYEGFIEGDFSQTNNVAEMGEDERSYETDVKIKVLGYLMGEGSNDEKPKISIRENVVEVKIPREKVVVDDINTNLRENDEGKGFYRE